MAKFWRVTTILYLSLIAIRICRILISVRARLHQFEFELVAPPVPLRSDLAPSAHASPAPPHSALAPLDGKVEGTGCSLKKNMIEHGIVPAVCAACIQESCKCLCESGVFDIGCVMHVCVFRVTHKPDARAGMTQDVAKQLPGYWYYARFACLRCTNGR